MPTLTVQRSKSPEERLDQLIRLKRAERPDASFWAEFEQGIRSKHLSSLVVYQPWYVRAGKMALLVSRKAAPTTAAAGALAIAFFTVMQSGYFAHDEADETGALVAETEELTEAPQFTIAQSETAVISGFEPAQVAAQNETSAIYRVPVMSRSSTATSYELRYTPQTLTTSTASGGEAASPSADLGAKVISTKQDF